MPEQPTDQQLPADSDTQEEYGWHQVAQEMHAWHPGLQEHARRHLEQRGLLHLVASSDAEDALQQGVRKYDTLPEQTQNTSSGVSQIRRILRPKIDSTVESLTETKVIADPEGIHVSDALTDEMKATSAEEFVLGHDIDIDAMDSADRVADKLYNFCVELMSEESVLRKYALATVIARGVSHTEFDDSNIFVLMNTPALVEEKGHNPSEYRSLMKVYDVLALEAGLDPEEDDGFWVETEAEMGVSIDPERIIANKLYKELIEDMGDDLYFESELGSEFEYGYETTERDTLDMLTVLTLNKGNKYYKRLLLRVFSEASRAESPVNVADYYEEAVSQVEQKISEGVIPSAFGDKLRLYHPKEFVYEDKMTAILNNRGHWAGYYTAEAGRFSIIEDYEELLPATEEQEAQIEFREPGTGNQYDESSDYKLKVAIHELFHHLSGHAYVDKGGEVHNRKVGLDTDSWGRMLNEAVTERLASLVYPQADQSYSEERAFLHALQSNSDGLITDGLLYDAYLEEREEGGLPQLKKLIQVIGEAYGQKGFIQRVDKVFEDDGYRAAINYLRRATEAMGRPFIEPPSSNGAVD